MSIILPISYLRKVSNKYLNIACAFKLFTNPFLLAYTILLLINYCFVFICFMSKTVCLDKFAQLLIKLIINQ